MKINNPFGYKGIVEELTALTNNVNGTQFIPGDLSFTALKMTEDGKINIEVKAINTEYRGRLTDVVYLPRSMEHLFNLNHRFTLRSRRFDFGERYKVGDLLTLAMKEYGFESISREDLTNPDDWDITNTYPEYDESNPTPTITLEDLVVIKGSKEFPFPFKITITLISKWSRLIGLAIDKTVSTELKRPYPPTSEGHPVIPLEFKFQTPLTQSAINSSVTELPFAVSYLTGTWMDLGRVDYTIDGSGGLKHRKYLKELLAGTKVVNVADGVCELIDTRVEPFYTVKVWATPELELQDKTNPTINYRGKIKFSVIDNPTAHIPVDGILVDSGFTNTPTRFKIKAPVTIDFYSAAVKLCMVDKESGHLTILSPQYRVADTVDWITIPDGTKLTLNDPDVQYEMRSVGEFMICDNMSEIAEIGNGVKRLTLLDDVTSKVTIKAGIPNTLTEINGVLRADDNGEMICLFESPLGPTIDAYFHPYGSAGWQGNWKWKGNPDNWKPNHDIINYSDDTIFTFTEKHQYTDREFSSYTGFHRRVDTSQSPLARVHSNYGASYHVLPERFTSGNYNVFDTSMMFAYGYPVPEETVKGLIQPLYEDYQVQRDIQTEILGQTELKDFGKLSFMGKLTRYPNYGLTLVNGKPKPSQPEVCLDLHGFHHQTQDQPWGPEDKISGRLNGIFIDKEKLVDAKQFTLTQYFGIGMVFGNAISTPSANSLFYYNAKLTCDILQPEDIELVRLNYDSEQTLLGWKIKAVYLFDDKGNLDSINGHKLSDKDVPSTKFYLQKGETKVQVGDVCNIALLTKLTTETESPTPGWYYDPTTMLGFQNGGEPVVVSRPDEDGLIDLGKLFPDQLLDMFEP